MEIISCKFWSCSWFISNWIFGFFFPGPGTGLVPGPVTGPRLSAAGPSPGPVTGPAPGPGGGGGLVH